MQSEEQVLYKAEIHFLLNQLMKYVICEKNLQCKLSTPVTVNWKSLILTDFVAVSSTAARYMSLILRAFPTV